MADWLFDDPRLVELYDPLDPDRSDLEHYCAIADELGARSVLDIGCGTGTFSCMLADRGVDVVGLDPSLASLDIARTKPGAASVRWIHGAVNALPPLAVDLVTMTGHVAQVFVSDKEWTTALRAARSAMNPTGHLAFETRMPDDRAWLRWTRDITHERCATVPGVGIVERWVEVTDVRPGVVSFRWTFVFETDGTTLTSDSTLRFRTRDEMTDSLKQSGFEIIEIRDAPGRPGREWVFIARSS